MKYLVAVVMVAVLAVPAFAGENPNARMFVSFDPDCVTGPYVHRTETTDGLVDCYLVVDCLGVAVRSVSLYWQTSGFGMAFAADYTVFHPTAQSPVGGPDNAAQGWLIAAPDAVVPNECDIVVIVKQPYFVSGAGTITILPSPVDGKQIVDSNFDEDFYCVLANGGLGQDPPPGDDPCECDTPVEPESWGSIKALYR